MSGQGNRWLSGNGDNPVNRVADHALLKVVSRLSATVGPAIAAWLFLQVWDGQREQARELVELRREISDRNHRLDLGVSLNRAQLVEHDRRLGHLEARARERD